MNKNLSKPVKILVLEQIALAASFYFGQVFLFCKNVLEWFLLITCKEHTLTRSTTLFSRNYPKLCFWLRRECRQMPDKNSHQRCFIEKAVLKNFVSHRKAPVLEPVFDKVACFQPWSLIRKTLQNRCFPAAKFLRKSILKNASELNLGSDYLEFCFWTVAFKIILTE